MINFLIVLFLLKRFAYQPFLRLLKERRQQIKEGIRKAEESEAERERIEQERKRVVGGARDKALAIIEEGRQRSKEKERRLLSQAEEERKRIFEEAIEQAKLTSERIAREKEEELKKTALSFAKEFLKEKIDKEKDKNFIASQLKKLGRQNGEKNPKTD
jgi:F-type H+-transporting ATPase subunit b